MHKRFLPFSAILTAILMLFGGAIAGVSAQDSGTPAATGTTEDSTPRPAHIHNGTCEDLGDVVYPLNNVSDVTIAGSPVPSPVVETPATPSIVQGEVVIESITDVDTSLDDLLGDEYAINAHESAEHADVYIACGNITGEADDQGQLTIDLDELNDSGFSGSAVLQDNGDGTTTVTITLVDQSDAMSAATPSA